MEKKITIGILALLILSVIPGVFAAITPLTGTCTFVGSTPAANTLIEENDTITVTMRANYNLTNNTIIYLGTNRTVNVAIANLTLNRTDMTAIFLNVPEGDYRISGQFGIRNDTGNGYDSDNDVVACTNRTFTLEMGEGGIILPVAVAAKQAESNNLSWLLLVALGALAVWAIFKDK